MVWWVSLFVFFYDDASYVFFSVMLQKDKEKMYIMFDKWNWQCFEYQYLFNSDDVFGILSAMLPCTFHIPHESQKKALNCLNMFVEPHTCIYWNNTLVYILV